MKICHTSQPDVSFRSAGEIFQIAGEWDSFLPENHPLESRFLKVLEDARLPDLRFHYLIISREQSTIGLAVFQHFRFHSGHYDSKALGEGPLFYLSQLFLCQETGILVCGNLFRSDSEGFYFPKPSDRNCLPGIAAELEKKWKPGALLLKDIRQPFPHAVLKKEGFRSFEEDEVMNLSLLPEWNNFGDYLSALSKKYRQRARRIIAAASVLRQTELGEKEICERINEIESLYMQVRNRQALRIGSLNGAYFLEMKKVFGKQFQVYAWFGPDDQMLAFSSHLLLEDGSREVHYIGFDYEANEQYFLYFNILFDGIRQAIDQGNSLVHFGRTGSDAKASTGAVPESNLHYFRVKAGLPALTFRILHKALTGNESRKRVFRNPFRSAGPEPELLEV